MKKFLAVLLSAFLWLGGAWGATYYMRADGSAVNKAAAVSCSAAATSLSIAGHNAETFSAGDIIILCDDGGVFRDQLNVPSSGSAGSPITYRAAAGESPIINGADVVSTWAAAGGEFTSTFSSTPTGNLEHGTNDFNMRQVLPAANISTSGTVIRVTVKAGPTGGTIDGMSIGEMSGTSDDYASAPTRITFDTGNSGTGAIGAGATKLSDEITFTLDETKSYLIHVWANDGYSLAYQASGGYGIYLVNTGGQSDLTLEETVALGTILDSRKGAVTLMEIQTALDNVWQATVTTEPLQVFFDNTKGTLVDNTAEINAANEWFWADNVLSVYSTSDPDTAYTSPGIEASQRGKCIYATGKDYITVDGIDTTKAGAVDSAPHNVDFTNSDYFILKNFTTTHGYHSGVCVTTTSSHGLIDNVTATLNGEMQGVGIGVWNPSADNNTISNNTATGNYGSGITNHGLEDSSDGPDGTWIHHNVSSQNGRKGISVTMANNTIVEYNTVDNNGIIDGVNGDGIRLSKGDYVTPWGTANIARYNVVSNNRVNGISISGQIDPQVYYNLIYGNGADADDNGNGISVFDFDGGAVYNNVIYNSRKFGLIILVNEGDNFTFKNNIIDTSRGRTAGIYVYDTASGYLTSDNNIVNNITYYGQIQTGGTYSLANWRTATSQDANSQMADPLFVSTVTPDFSLQAGSPAINAGVDVGLVVDYLGNTVPYNGTVDVPDIGAYEYQGDAEGGAASGCPYRLVSFSQAVACYGGSGTKFDRANAFYAANGCASGTIADREKCFTTAAGCTGAYVDRWLCTLGVTGGRAGISDYLHSTYGD